MEEKIKDPSVTGVSGLKGVNTREDEFDKKYAYLKPSRTRAEWIANKNSREMEAPTQNVGFVGVGDSKYDEEITSLTQLGDLNNFRGETQPWHDQIGAGLAKAGVLAATTFVGSTLGVLVGGLSVATGGSYWDTGLNRYLDNINKASEEAMPNYYTNEELENKWYQNIFTANFIGDKFIKNMGFAAGAAAAGILTGGGIAAGIKSLTGGIKVGSLMTRGLASVAMSSGEANIEALNTADEFAQSNTQYVNDNFEQENLALKERTLNKFEQISRLPNKLVPSKFDNEGNPIEYKDQKELALINLRQEQLNEEGILNLKKETALAETQKLRTDVGNVTFGANLALLTLSGNIQMGNLIGGGFNKARKNLGVVLSLKGTGEKLGREAISTRAEAMLKSNLKASARGGYKAAVAGKTAINALSEGLEEAGQNVVSTASQIKYSNDLNTFAGQKLNPYIQDEVNGFLSATTQSLKENFGTLGSSGFEEMFLGIITGGPGIPTIGKRKSGKNGLILAGGFKEAMAEADQLYSANEAVDIVNERMQDPKFLELYQGLGRHKAYENIENEYANEGNQFAFKNTEESKVVSDILLFRNTGMLEEYLEMLDKFTTISKEDVNDLKKSTTIGDTGVSIQDGIADEDVVTDVASRAKRYRDDAKQIINIHENNLVSYSDKFSKDGLEELTHMMYKAQSSNKRKNVLLKEIQDVMRPIISNLDDKNISIGNTETNDNEKVNALQLLEKLPELFAKEMYTNGTQLQVLTNELIGGNLKRYQSALKDLESLEQRSGEYKTNTEFNNAVKLARETIEDIRSNEFTIDPNEMMFKLQDALMLAHLSQSYQTKTLNAILNPASLEELIDNDVAKSANEEEIKKEIVNTEELQKAQSPDELNEIVNDIPDIDQLKVLDSYAINNEGTELGNYAKELSKMKKNSKLLESMMDRDDFSENSAIEKIELTKAIEEALFQSNTEEDFFNILNDKANLNETLRQALDILMEHKDMVSRVEKDNVIPKDPEGKNPENPKTKLDVVSSTTSNSESNSAIDNSMLEDAEVNPEAIQTLTTTDTINEINTILGDSNNASTSTDAITEAVIDPLRKEGKYIPFGKYSEDAKKADNSKNNYAPLWNKLSERGVFKFINSGTLSKLLKKNKELKVHFVVDNAFNNSDPFNRATVFSAVKLSKPTNTTVTINEEYYQVVGAIKNNSAITNSIVNNTLSQSFKEGSTEMSVSDQTAKIERITPGRMVLEDEIVKKGERDVNPKNPIFGVQTTKGFTAPLLKSGSYLSPKKNKPGAVFMMVQMANGQYIPTGVVVKRFNNTEYSISQNRESPVYHKIYNSIEGIMKHALGIPTDKSVQEYRIGLESSLYFGRTLAIGQEKGQEFKLRYGNFNGETFISYDRLTGVDENGKKTYQSLGSITIESMNDLYNVLDFIQYLNLRFQVDYNRLEDAAYNKELVDSKIMTTNLADQDNFRNATVILKTNTSENTKPTTTSYPKPVIIGTEKEYKLVIIKDKVYKYHNDGKITDDIGNTIKDKKLLSIIFAKNYISNNIDTIEALKFQGDYVYKIPKDNTYYGVSVHLEDNNINDVFSKNTYDKYKKLYDDAVSSDNSSKIETKLELTSKKETVNNNDSDILELYNKNGFNSSFQYISIDKDVINIVESISGRVLTSYNNNSELTIKTISALNESLVKAIESGNTDYIVNITKNINSELKTLDILDYSLDINNQTNSTNTSKQNTSSNKTNLIRQAIAGTITNISELENNLENPNNNSIFDKINREQQIKLRDALRARDINANSLSEIISNIEILFKEDKVSINSFPTIEDIINKIKCK